MVQIMLSDRNEKFLSTLKINLHFADDMFCSILVVFYMNSKFVIAIISKDKNRITITQKLVDGRL